MKLDHTGRGVCVQENKTKDEKVSTVGRAGARNWPPNRHS